MTTDFDTPPVPVDQDRSALLVLADTALTRHRTIATLRAHGVAALEGRDPESALAAYPSPRPAGILLDGSTRPDHGLPAVQALRAFDPTAGLTLLVSGAPRAIVADAARAGVRDLIVAPASEERLVQAARTLLTPPDRRRHARLPVHLAARLGLGAAPRAYRPCAVDDLSEGGARIHLGDGSDALPTAATVVHLRLVLPGHAGLVLAVGHVVRAIPPDHLALAFMHLSVDHRAWIAAYIRDLGDAHQWADEGSSSRPAH